MEHGSSRLTGVVDLFAVRPAAQVITTASRSRAAPECVAVMLGSPAASQTVSVNAAIITGGERKPVVAGFPGRAGWRGSENWG